MAGRDANPLKCMNAMNVLATTLALSTYT